MENLSENLAAMIAQHQWSQKYQELLLQAVKDQDVQQFLQAHPQIKNEDLNNGMDAIYEFVQAKKRMQQIAPGYLPVLIWKNNRIFVSYEPDEQLLAQQKQREFKNKFRTLNMASDIDQASIEDFGSGNPSRQEAYSQAMRFILNYVNKNNDFVPGLYLSGNFGVGKTYLLAAIAKELVQQDVSVLLVHFPTFAVQMKKAINDNSVMDKVDEIKSVPVLMLDDIGADALSSWMRDEVLGVILQYRMQEKLPTFFSSNFDMVELQKHLAANQRGDVEPVKAARIMERIRFLSQEVIVSGDNLRQRNN